MNKAEKAQNEELAVEENAAVTDSTDLIERLNEADSASSAKSLAETAPLYSILSPSYYNQGSGVQPAQTARVGMALVKDTANINRMLKQVKTIFPRDMKLAWCVKPS